ncbi:hypothetical protein V1264_022610 [Littorina saxatilis]
MAACLVTLSPVYGWLPRPKEPVQLQVETALEQKLEKMQALEKQNTVDVLDVNLMTGVTSSLPAGMTWHSKLTSGRGECACDRQGVLKLTVEGGMAAQINMTFSHSSGFTFNVGDSVTNDGYGGDRNTQQNDAEVHSINNAIYFYGRDKRGPGGGSYGLLHSEGGFVATQPFTTVTLHVADELATAHNGLKYLYINSHKMFALNGQSDAGGVNYDVYLGMNRVVDSTARTGTGLCNVSVRFYQL